MFRTSCIPRKADWDCNRALAKLEEARRCSTPRGLFFSTILDVFEVLTELPQELNLPYEEVIIDLDKPREPWYLEVNPVRVDCGSRHKKLLIG